MFVILSGIQDLMQHFHHFSKKPDDYRPASCPSCGHLNLHKHGCYERQADRNNPSKCSLNPVKIPRFRCARCRRTCSVLPECLSPRRWYDWETQEKALKAHTNGLSCTRIAKDLKPSRTTIARWMRRFADRFMLHADHLRQRIPSLTLFSEWKSFWGNCLSKISLAKAMYNLHGAQIYIP